MKHKTVCRLCNNFFGIFTVNKQAKEDCRFCTKLTFLTLFRRTELNAVNPLVIAVCEGGVSWLSKSLTNN